MKHSFSGQKGNVRFTLPVTVGTTGPQWIIRLKKKGFQISKWAENILSSPGFKPTFGIVNNVSVCFVRGPVTRVDKVEADTKILSVLNAEVACLILDSFSREDILAMGFTSIWVMHEEIDDSHVNTGGLPSSENHLIINCDDTAIRLDTYYDLLETPDVGSDEYGVAFSISDFCSLN